MFDWCVVLFSACLGELKYKRLTLYTLSKAYIFESIDTWVNSVKVAVVLKLAVETYNFRISELMYSLG